MGGTGTVVPEESTTSMSGEVMSVFESVLGSDPLGFLEDTSQKSRAGMVPEESTLDGETTGDTYLVYAHAGEKRHEVYCGIPTLVLFSPNMYIFLVSRG